MVDINIVLLNYLCKDDITRAVESLVADTKDCPYQVQITVADNSENKDGMREALQKFSQVVYVDSTGNVGFGKGNVVGFKTAESRYYFALNRDTIIPENSKTIERIVAYMDAHPKIGCIGPKLLNMDDTLQYSCYRFDLPSILIKPLKQINFDKKYKWVKKHADKLEMKDFDHHETRPVDWVLGAAMIVRKEVVDEIGWFDDRYFMYLEDCDWCHRMWDAGWPVYYVHDIEIIHMHARESAKVPGLFKALFKNKLARIHAKSWIQYLWKWRGKHKYYATKI
ncbi:MAG: glycosyltransferase family 2 protein [Candidatus Magasanikbacteria bacterium]|nr:glycosyltransferase family 2 protein [Candidatus Magasanikbacteria bacterium]